VAQVAVKAEAHAADAANPAVTEIIVAAVAAATASARSAMDTSRATPNLATRVPIHDPGRLPMNILVTGGRGYIGSHACKLLARAGHKVVCIDDESYGRADVSAYAECHRISTRDSDKLTALLRDKSIDAVMHFAAYIFVGESVEKPDLYYENNVAGTLSLLAAMKAAEVKKIIFSSTCATYAELKNPEPLTELHAQDPISPYGRSKLMCEQIMRDYCATLGFSAVIFRYFNASGADPENEFGEDHVPETHLGTACHSGSA
jgi:UDP-glucose 4-epimerase